MSLKLYNVEAFLPELSSAHAHQSTRVTAPDLGRAADLGFTEIKSRDTVKGKHLKTVKIIVTQVEIQKRD